jgi:hypothetical protein
MCLFCQIVSALDQFQIARRHVALALIQQRLQGSGGWRALGGLIFLTANGRHTITPENFPGDVRWKRARELPFSV